MLRRTVGLKLESLGMGLREALGVAARLGVDSVEFDATGELSPRELGQTARRDIRHTIRSHGLKLAAIGFPTRHGYDHSDRLDARIQGTADALSLAYDLGAGLVINHVGRIPPDKSSPQSIAFQEAMNRVADQAERVGSRLAIQTGLESPSALAVLLAKLGRHGLAVNFAPANLLVTGVNLEESLERLATWIVNVHVRDAVRSGLATAGVREVPLGTGEVNWDRLLELLSGIEFRGSLTLVRETSSRETEDLAAAIPKLRV